jgi:glycosyltransferase involved in cell wall biosynthesis
MSASLLRSSVILNALAPASGGLGTGTGTYAHHLASELASVEGVHIAAICRPDAELPHDVERITVNRLSRRPRATVIEDSIRLPLALRRARRADSVFHNLAFHAPPALVHPWVQTLHDVIPLALTSPDLAALRRRWGRIGTRYRKAAAIIAVSHHAAADGIRLLGLDADRIHVAYHGIDSSFRLGDAAPSGPPYLLVVGEYSPRKGFGEAISVFDALADAGYPHDLVVAGRVHPSSAQELAALRSRSPHAARIHLRGLVPDIVTLYQGATAFLMTSRYEGFGLPALEAMACGVPVVAFSNSAVTEIVGVGGQLVSDGDVVAMTTAVRHILDSPAAAVEWRERGAARASEFTWTRSAAVHLDVYRSVAP